MNDHEVMLDGVSIIISELEGFEEVGWVFVMLSALEAGSKYLSNGDIRLMK
ncbi:MAG: hypothetical protein OCD76_22460 [Reichenbachiella sp.]